MSYPCFLEGKINGTRKQLKILAATTGWDRRHGIPSITQDDNAPHKKKRETCSTLLQLFCLQSIHQSALTVGWYRSTPSASATSSTVLMTVWMSGLCLGSKTSIDTMMSCSTLYFELCSGSLKFPFRILSLAPSSNGCSRKQSMNSKQPSALWQKEQWVSQKQPCRGCNSCYPDVSFLCDWPIQVQVEHFWGSVHWCCVTLNLQKWREHQLHDHISKTVKSAA